MYCRFCGSLIDDDAKFCPVCGKCVDENIVKEVELTKEVFDNSSGIVIAAKVFIILGSIFGLFTIIAPIIGILTFLEVDKVETKDELTVYAVLTLIFCSLIGGILLLCSKNKTVVLRKKIS